MTAIVAAVMRRSYTADMFADLTDIPHARTWDRVTGVTTLTFDADLDAATVQAIWAQMESTDDGDQARRAALREAATAGATNLAQMLVAYTLGDPMPAAVLPATTTTTAAKAAAVKAVKR